MSALTSLRRMRVFRAVAAAVLVVVLLGAQNTLAGLVPGRYGPAVRIAVLEIGRAHV